MTFDPQARTRESLGDFWDLLGSPVPMESNLLLLFVLQFACGGTRDSAEVAPLKP